MESITQMQGIADVATDPTIGGALGTGRRELMVRDVMSKDVFTAATDDTVFSAAKKMSENCVSCVVVVDGTAVVGILTEKDVLKGVAREDIDFRRLRVSDRMSAPAEVVPATMAVIKAGEMMETRHIKRLPVLEDGQLAGIVTQTDITRGLVSLSPLRSVSDIMTTNVATVQADTAVTEAARIMASKGISCVVALHRHEVAGILTEKDLLKRVVALHKNPGQTCVADVMSFPITTIPPTFSVLSASKKMDNMHLHRLIVTDGKKICGIVTQTDLMRAIRNELARLGEERRMLTAELASLRRYVTQNPKRLEDYLAEMAGSPGTRDEAARAMEASTRAQRDTDDAPPCIS